MKLWPRLLITFVIMIFASLVVGLIWHDIFEVRMPSYLSGVVGGLAALTAWEYLRSK